MSDERIFSWAEAPNGGNINALGFVSEEDNIIKLNDSKIAGELLKEIL